ncbi:MAG TPA: ATP-dependent helicase [Acholeplasma sp.]|jgi:DNA helicase-2/ATP-dependent DNA helicase PcrA|nr:ATP-dependent helicase [Acholeplasma sp.]
MLNKQQLKVVNSNDHFIFLLAGAGTGKTTVIINKIKLLLNKGVMAENVLVLSFTRKSANDLKVKLKGFEEVVITTFHGLCYNLLKDEIKIKIVEEEWLVSNGFSLNDLVKIGLYKRNNKESKLVKKYNHFLRENGLLDYTDLEHLLVKKLKSDRAFKNKISSKFKYIFVDEFQDTSIIQYELLKELIGSDSKCFCVGDPNQSIYSFRGASEKVISKYNKDYKASLYLLNINYRSDKEILRVSNRLISYNKGAYKFNLVPKKKDEGIVIYKCFDNGKDKVEYILNEIRKLLDLNIFQEEIAVIYRNHHFANELKRELFKTYFDRVNFLTVHQVKGLEFDCVFFIGLEEEKLPFKGENIEEERRLFYVGITRARHRLYLLSKNKKKISRFIIEALRRKKGDKKHL